MSSVLATKITKAMINRAGYIPLETTTDEGGFIGIFDESFMYYTFKDCLKVQDSNFNKWVCYWDGLPFAVVCDVKADKLANGFVKIAILSKNEVPISEIGTMPGNSNILFGTIINGKLLNTKGVQQFVVDNLSKTKSSNIDIQVSQPAQTQRKADKTVLSNAEIKNLKEAMEQNWGITLK
jgi:hypothetical protein